MVARIPLPPLVKGVLRFIGAGDSGGVKGKIITIINKHGQVTIPVAVRRVLGVEPGDTVTFTLEDREVRLARAVFILESAYGSVKPSRRPENFERLSSAPKEGKVEKLVRKDKSG